MTDLSIGENGNCIEVLKSTGLTGGTEVPTRRGSVTEGTCEWLEQVPEYRSWIKPESSSRLLWIHGPAGKGKTFLSIHLADKLGQQKNRVLQYFCDKQDSNRSTADSVLTGLVCKLLNDINECPHDSYDFAKRNDLHKIVQGHLSAIAKGNEAHHKAMWSAFENIICAIQGDVYIVLDGLDECDKESIDFLTKKFGMMSSSKIAKSQKLRTLIVSRNPGTDPAISIDLRKHTEAIERDLLWYIYQRAARFDPSREDHEKLNGLKRYDLYKLYKSGELKQLYSKGKLCSILLDRADKTYLWVALAMDMLNSDKVKEILESEDAVDKFLPEGLHAMVNRGLLEALEGEDEPRRRINLEDMARIIRCVSVAFRPLTAAELRATIKVTDDSIRKFKHILSLPTEVNEGKSINDKTELRLVHLSLKEYLLRPSHTFRFPSSIGLLLRPYLLRPVSHLVRLAKDGPFLEHCLAAAVPLALWSHLSYAITIPVVAGYVSMLWKKGPRKFHPVRSFLEKLHQSLKLCIFSVHEKQAHENLSERCLDIMKIRLPTDPDSEIAEENRRCEDLDYACQYWAQHLQEGEKDLNDHTVPTSSQPRPLHQLGGHGLVGGMFWIQRLQRNRLLDDNGVIHQFFLEHLLHWFEALGRMGKVSDGIRAIFLLQSMIAVSKPLGQCKHLANKRRRHKSVSCYPNFCATSYGSFNTTVRASKRIHFKSTPAHLYLHRQIALLESSFCLASIPGYVNCRRLETIGRPYGRHLKAIRPR